MAIKNVPQIRGTETYNGVIYGLNMNIGYSSTPSKLTLDIVNKNGIYGTPTLGSPQTITFGNFRFQGKVWSYSTKESANEKTLHVTLIDNSVELDQKYVLLWKRGFLGEKGRPTPKKKTFDFSDESILVPSKIEKVRGFPFTKFVEKTLTTEIAETNVFTYKGTIGGAIVLGTEKFPSTICDIPDTDYTFNDLKSLIRVNGIGWPSDNTWKSTHEGTLREVLSSWCSDLGYDFYWDYSGNKLVFYSTSRGIGSIPDVTASNIISKEETSTLEGTFRHYGIGYTAIPRSALKALNASQSVTILYTTSPYPLSYFMNKIGAPQSPLADKGRWGGDRSQNEFLHAGLLGYVSRALRDLYSFQEKHWTALGYKKDTGRPVNKPQIISFLKKQGFQDMISDLESFDAKGLPNYDFSFVSRDPTLADKWNEIEQTLIPYVGKYYRSSDSSGSFFYCNSKTVVSVTITVDPEGQFPESDTDDFQGRKVIDRSGTMSHDSSTAQDNLNYDRLINDISNCAPIHIDLKESGILDALKISELIGNDTSNQINTLVISPNSDRFVKSKIGFNSRFSAGRSHPLEKNIWDIKAANQENGKKNCPQFEAALEAGSCRSFEDMARKKALKNAGQNDSQSNNPDDYISGLITTPSYQASIKLKNGSVDLHSPSYGNMQVVCNYNIEVSKISSFATEQLIFSSGRPGGASDVAEIRISNENITDPEQDEYAGGRVGNLIRPSDSQCTTPQKTIKYVFAGEPTNVSLDPSRGLSSLDVTLSADGFITTATFSTQPPKFSKANNTVRYVHSQFNRASYNAS
jgi:hypothetical protein